MSRARMTRRTPAIRRVLLATLPLAALAACGGDDTTEGTSTGLPDGAEELVGRYAHFDVVAYRDPSMSTGIISTGFSDLELRDGEPVRLRPWRLRLTTPGELDRWAGDAGLRRVAVWHDWSGAELGDDDGAVARIAVYRAPLTPA